MWRFVDRGRGVKNVIFCGRHKWMAPNLTLTTLHRPSRRCRCFDTVFMLLFRHGILSICRSFEQPIPLVVPYDLYLCYQFIIYISICGVEKYSAVISLSRRLKYEVLL